jgi:alpha,alpha-trehalase
VTAPGLDPASDAPAPTPGTGPHAAPAADVGDHALLSDRQGAALVARDGTITWACLPRFDSPAVFAALLDDDAGHWRVRAVEPSTVTRRYLTDTLVLETEHRTAVGVVVVTDALVFGADDRGHDIGRTAPHIVVRLVTCTRGSVEVELDLAPRPEYGLTQPTFVGPPSTGDGASGLVGGAHTVGGPVTCVVHAPAIDGLGPLVLEHHGSGCVGARFTLAAGERRVCALQVAEPWAAAPPWLDGPELVALLDGTIASWRSWTELHTAYDGPYRDEVALSGRVLEALGYAPTGAIVAAPTTSLPERPGGDRNWDYRYCWVRDASLTVAALATATCADEGTALLRFFATAGGGVADGCSLQVVYGVAGERLLPEAELDHLDGWADSRPVRVGNAAWRQEQTDVYGELLDAACSVVDQIDATTAPFLVHLADRAIDEWRRPDAGIWEVRDEPRHFTHSKLMSWVALDRAVQLADRLDASHRVDAWCAARDAVRDAILARAWDDDARTFTQSFGDPTLDAALLLIPVVGFLPPDDARVLGTIDAVQARLTDADGFVYRNEGRDGEAPEGTFTLCTFWLVQCLALVDRLDEATALFERVLARANDIGLLAEELAAGGHGQLGNFPQAFTHVGLINAAAEIGRVRAARAGTA